MIYDTNKIAEKRLKEDYNVYGYPTVFVDGGYKVISGDKPKYQFANAIRSAENRDVPDVRVILEISYDNETNELETKVLIENNENYNYSGTLKVYLTEKISRWINRHKTSSGETVLYHFGFLDFIINENIKIEGKSNITCNVKKKITEFSVPDVNAEDIAVMAVVFRSEPVKGYSFPDSKEGKFNAYYVDAVAKAEIIGKNNSPPIISIVLPEVGKINLFGKPLFKTYFGGTYLIGKVTIKVDVKDDKGVEKVQFYIDDKLVGEDKEEPFEYNFRKIDYIRHLIRKHTIKIVAFDNEEKYSSTYLDVITLLL